MAIVPFTIDNHFAQETWLLALRYAENRFSAWASAKDCEDMVQDAMLKLYENIHEGKLTKLICGLPTYVIGIMKNIALKKYETMSKNGTLPFMTGQSDDDEIDPVDIASAKRVVRDWQHIDEEETALLQQNAVREIVANMEEPCRTILWGYYWEDLSMAEIAKKAGQKNADVAKTQKSRCMTKVKTAMEKTYKILNS